MKKVIKKLFKDCPHRFASANLIVGVTAKRVYIRTFGCQMNEHDSEVMRGLLKEAGYVLCGNGNDVDGDSEGNVSDSDNGNGNEAAFTVNGRAYSEDDGDANNAGKIGINARFYSKAESEADIILFNTCSVRQHAEERVWGKLGMLAKLRREKPGLVFGVLGCMAQAWGHEIFERAPYVNLVCGPKAMYRLPELLSKVDSSSKLMDIEKTRTACKEEKSEIGSDIKEKINSRQDFNRISYLPRVRESSVCAWVAIMEGCNNFCSYCVVPYVRGVERSRPLEDIVREVEGLAGAGYKEIALLGQNVNSYGRNTGHSHIKQGQDGSRAQRDEGIECGGEGEALAGVDDRIDNIINFVRLLEELNGIAGVMRIRFVTSHPKDAGAELFEAIARLDKVCEHIHLPVQSGSDRILKLMNRKYTARHYRKLVQSAREIVPGISISTDIIVGFPSETKEDFKDTCRLMEEMGFDSAFIFKYSARPGTGASRLKDDVPPEVKLERNHRLLKIQEKISQSKNKSLVGVEVEVLVEGKADKRNVPGDRTSEKEISAEDTARRSNAGISKPGIKRPEINRTGQKIPMMGRTRTGKTCIFEAGTEDIGRLVRVKVEKATAYSLRGKVIDGVGDNSVIKGEEGRKIVKDEIKDEYENRAVMKRWR